jgi:hypothetical protein
VIGSRYHVNVQRLVRVIFLPASESKYGKFHTVGQYDKLLARILGGASDANISFAELCHMLRDMGFDERIRGSHHIFRKHGIEEMINLQCDGNKAKAYQVRQVRNVILKHRLGGVADA